MKNFKILIAIIISIATFSCKKDTTTVVDPNPTSSKTCYVNKMDNGSDGYSLIEYNSMHQVTKVTDFDPSGVAAGTYMEFTYATNLLQTMINYDGTAITSKIVMHYTSNKPDTAEVWSDDGSGLVQVGYYLYTYIGADIVKVEMYYEYMGVLLNVSKTEFTYSNGNVATTTDYQMGATFQLELTGSVSYEYDSKKNPLTNIGLNYLVMGDNPNFMSKNNVTKETIKDASGVIQNDQSMNYLYEYTSNDYPSKQTSTAFDNSSTTISINTYDCF